MFTECGKRPFTSLMLRIVFVALACVTMPSMSQAELFYNFVQERTGDVLATLELSSLPATARDINGLTFTSHGDALFGLPSPYPGTFSTLIPSREFVFGDDGMGGLTGGTFGSRAYDWNPPESSVYPYPTGFFVLEGSRTDQFGRRLPDRMGLSLATTPQSFIGTNGHWLRVPEPSGVSILAVMFLLGAGFGRRRKN